MVKTDLIREIANRTEMNQKDVDAVIKAFGEIVVENTVNAEDSVPFPGVGTFKVKEVKERTGTIMMGDRKGESYTTPAHSERTFKMSKPIKTI